MGYITQRYRCSIFELEAKKVTLIEQESTKDEDLLLFLDLAAWLKIPVKTEKTVLEITASSVTL